jgi:hypothetical protein
VQCYNCENFAHYADECLHRKDVKKSQKNDEQANIVQDDDSDFDVVILMATTCEGDPMCED